MNVIIEIIICGLVLLVTGGFLYSNQLLINQEQDYYEQVPSVMLEATMKTNEQITPNMTIDSKLKIIDFNCKQYFPMRYGVTIEQSQCMQNLTAIFIK